MEDFGSRWETFFEEVKLQEIQLLTNNSTEFRIRFNDIQSWDPEFAKRILVQPNKLIRMGEKILAEICKRDGIRVEPDILLEHLPPDVERDLRDIGSGDLKKLRCIDVIVTKVSEIKPRIYDAVWKCESCGANTHVAQDNELELNEPLVCSGCELPGGRGKDCTRFKIQTDDCTWTNNQYIEIQELPERVKGSGQPSRGKVLIEGNQCNKFLPGERITANLIPYTQAGYHRNTKSSMFETVYSLHSATHESKLFNDIRPSEEEIKTIQEISQRGDLMNLMRDSIAPTIIDVSENLKFVKRSLVLQLFGGVSRINADGTRNRGDIHILLMGDPGIAKSQLLTYMSKIAPRAMFASGGNVSKAGLTAAAIKDGFGDGRYALEAGVLPLADQGIACIDEIDKISKEDKGALHEAMEQQMISVSKGGISTQLRSRCSVLSAANPEEGNFVEMGEQTNLSRAFNQVDLPLPLATRFDIIWLLRDIVNDHQDEEIARHIMAHRNKAIPEGKIEENKLENPIFQDEDKTFKTSMKGDNYLTSPFLQKYIAYAKTHYYPELTDPAKAIILQFYREARNTYSDDSKKFMNSKEDKPIPITARALESLIRLSEAHARMHLRNEVLEDDAEMAVAIFKHWRNEEGGETISDRSTGSPYAKRQIMIRTLDIIRDINQETGDDAFTNDIYSRALALNPQIQPNEVDTAIQQLSQDTQIIMPYPGRWRVN